MKRAVSVLLVLVVAHLFAEQVRADLCEDLRSDFQTCLRFFFGQDPAPSAECCNGARVVRSKVKSTEDKRALCKCIRVNEIVDNANRLFSTCNAPLPFVVTDHTDCDKIQ